MAIYKLEIKTDRDSWIIGQRVNLSTDIFENESILNSRRLNDLKLSLWWEVSPESLRLLTDVEEPHIAVLEGGESSTPGEYRVTVSLRESSNKLIATDTRSITLKGYSICSVTRTPYKPDSFMDFVHSYVLAEGDEEDEALKKLVSTPSTLFQGFETLLLELEMHANEALAGQPLTFQMTRFKSKFLKVASVLLNNKYPSEAKAAVNRLYQIVRSQEVPKKERFHKGTVLWWHARACQELGSPDEAGKYFLLAMIEDIRTNSTTWHELGAHDWLINGLQKDATTVDQVGETARNLMQQDQWDTREPEITWLQLKRQRHSISRAPLDFLKAISNEFLRRAQDLTSKDQDKGDDLEYLLAYLFASEPGFEVLGPTRSPDSQNDVLVRNRHDDKAILSLGDYFIVECKNWNKKVGAPIVREFAGRLRSAKVKTGVLASRMGITGKSSKRGGARDTISKEYLQDATAVLVLDESTIIDLSYGKTSVSARLLEEFENVRFDIR